MGAMPDPDLQERMRADWDRRAREDACYYVAFGRRQQSTEEFFSTASDALRAIRAELRRLPPGRDPKTLSALEIGCGPGRLLAPLSRVFGEVVGVDVSQEMVERARDNLRGIANARVEVVSGSDLAAFPQESFDFCYSYAVFQHIPSHEVVVGYLREVRRVLKTGGLLKLHFNGLPEVDQRGADTWSGVRFGPDELRAFCREHDLQLHLLEGAQTPSLWMAASKREAGWSRSVRAAPGARILTITNASTDDLVVPASGRFSGAALKVENLSHDADLNNLEVEIAGRRAVPSYMGQYVWNGPTQVNVFLPPGTPTGLQQARLWMCGEPITPTTPMRVIPAPPPAPRVREVTDGVNVMSVGRVETGSLKISVEEAGPEPAFGVEIDGARVAAGHVYCVDPLSDRYEINLDVPADIPPGRHSLTVRLRERRLAAVEIEIAG
jgi:SAM-dependent methyltransferase